MLRMQRINLLLILFRHNLNIKKAVPLCTGRTAEQLYFRELFSIPSLALATEVNSPLLSPFSFISTCLRNVRSHAVLSVQQNHYTYHAVFGSSDPENPLLFPCIGYMNVHHLKRGIPLPSHTFLSDHIIIYVL